MTFKTTLLAAVACLAVPRAFAGEMSIIDALGQLDPKDDSHWTADGLPRIDKLKSMTGNQSISRDMVEEAKPGFNREVAGGENRPGNGMPEQAPAPSEPQDPMAAAQADGWAPHPDSPGFHYRGQDVKSDADVASMYGQPSGDENASDIAGQTGMGGAMTARSPEPVEGETRKTHVSEPSQGEPGEKPIGITQGMTEQGVNTLGTPEGSVENPARDIELSGEVQARNAGSVLTPAQAAAQGSNTPGISLGGAADPLVEARTKGGSVLVEGADEAEFLEGETIGGPFGHSGITAGNGPGQAQLGSMDVDFDGDPDTVEALESQLETQSHKTAELRAKVDEVSEELHQSLRTEAQLRREIDANRPRSGNMTTIQSFLRSTQERRAAKAREERK